MRDYVRAAFRKVGGLLALVGALVGAATIGAAWGQAHPEPPAPEKRPRD